MNGKLGLKPVAQIRRSTSSSLPSVNITRLPSSRGFIVSFHVGTIAAKKFCAFIFRTQGVVCRITSGRVSLQAVGTHRQKLLGRDAASLAEADLIVSTVADVDLAALERLFVD